MIENVHAVTQLYRQGRLVLQPVFIAPGKTNNTRTGFSFIEYLATLTIAALLLVMTAANFQPVLDRSRVISASGEFYAAISLARAEAVRRHTRVDLIPSDANDWAQGWLVLIDANNNQHYDSGDLSLHRSRGEMKGVHVEGKLRDSKKIYLAFDSSGRPRSADSPQVPQIGSFIFSAGTQRRKIIMSFLGRVRLCDPDKDAATC
jgi:type IV fimbrial biogenesis protein FimT